MVELIISKRHVHIHGKVYSQGDKVELDDKLALLLLEENAAISATTTKLPTDSEGLFGELQIKVANLEKQVEQQKTMIANFTKELELKNNRIAELEAIPSKRK